MTRKVSIWDSNKEELLRRCYGDTPNALLAKELGVSVPYVKKKAAVLGLRKSPTYNVNHGIKDKIMSIGISRYSYSEIASMLGCHKNTVARYVHELVAEGLMDACDTAGVGKKISRIRHETIKKERGRVWFGMEQRTNIKVFSSVKKMAVRKRLRRYGYDIERGGSVAVIRPDTLRHERSENTALRVGISFDLDWDAFKGFSWEGGAEEQFLEEEQNEN